MNTKKGAGTFFYLFVIVLFSAVPAFAQYLVVSAEQVHAWLTGNKKAVVIDVRNPDEYRAGHVPGSVNIYAENIKRDRAKLPQDKSTPLIFYCRGVG